MRLATWGAVTGASVFDVAEKGKLATSDAYEDHFMLPHSRILLITSQRCALLQVNEYIAHHQPAMRTAAGK